MSLESSLYGTMPDGTPVKLYTLRNGHGTEVKVTEYGLIITEVRVRDRAGHLGNVVLGFDRLDRYVQGNPMFGALVGRVANRIAGARFTLDGHEYTLAKNNGPNNIHGGPHGFDQKVWQSWPLPVTEHAAAVSFARLSPDGESGFPGNLFVQVRYTLTDQDELRIDYRATTDQATPINLTNHSYFNLAGSGDVLGDVLMIAADFYTPNDANQIPTGEIRSVHGTPLDFTTPTTVGERYQQTGLGSGGYDHNYVLRSGGHGLALAARVYEPKTGRVLEVFTTEPGVQLYTANGLNGSLVGTGNQRYPRFGGLCLETQHFPDSVHEPHFPSTILRPGETYHSTTVYRFSTRD